MKRGTNYRGRNKPHVTIALPVTQVKRSSGMGPIAADRAIERLGLVVDAFGLGFCDWDLRGGHISYSGHAPSILGIELAQPGGSFDDFLRCVHPDDRTPLEKKIADVLEKRHDEGCYQYRVIWPDGTVHSVEGLGRTIFDVGGEPLRMIGTVVDVTERKTDEEEQGVRDLELGRLSRINTMGRMAAGLAHELNQPLTSIVNYASTCIQLSKSAQPVSPVITKSLAEIMNASRRASAIMNWLRSFLHKQEPRKTALDVNELVNETIHMMQFELGRQNLRPQIRLESSSPRVLGDKVQIQQVLVNLIFNALEAMESIGAERKQLIVQTTLFPEHRSVAVSVIDSGPGVSPDNLRKLFKPIRSTKPSGLGIGLSISRSIVETHKGQLTAESNPDRGMQFRFTLPTVEEGRDD